MYFNQTQAKLKKKLHKNVENEQKTVGVYWIICLIAPVSG